MLIRMILLWCIALSGHYIKQRVEYPAAALCAGIRLDGVVADNNAKGAAGFEVSGPQILDSGYRNDRDKKHGFDESCFHRR